MSRRKPPKKQDFRDEILRHLEQNPPPEERRMPAPTPQSKKQPGKSQGGRRRDARPALMLRGMTEEAALDRLERFLRQHRRHGTPEVLLIVGKGSRSPAGESILAPAVREFCERRPALVRRLRDAAANEGGGGAWIVELEQS